MTVDWTIASNEAQSSRDFAVYIRPDLDVRIFSSVGEGVGNDCGAVSIFASD